MAARPDYKLHTCTGTPVSLETILGYKAQISSLVARAGKDNVGLVYWGGATVSSTDCGGYLEKGDAVCIDMGQKYLGSDHLYFSGTEDDILALTAIQ